MSIKVTGNVVDDGYGNCIVRQKNFLYLRLKGDDSLKMLGEIDFTQRIMKVHRNRNKHLYVKYKAYGFNHFMIKYASTFDKILLSDNFGMYLIPTSDILEKGKYINHKKSGFELQVLFPVKLLQIYRI